MIAITIYWAWVTFTLLCSLCLLIYAYMTGDQGSSFPLPIGSKETGQPGMSSSRLLRLCRKNEGTWRLPGIRRTPRDRSFGKVAVAYQANYTSRFSDARKMIPR
jgi:hypothetical protein